MHGVANALINPEPDSLAGPKKLKDWTSFNKVCCHTILSTLSDELFDVYCSYKEAHKICESLLLKYIAKDVGRQKFIIGNFYHWEMTDNKDICLQINEYHTLLEDFKVENLLTR